MKINKKVKDFLKGFFWPLFLVLFVLAITSNSFPIQITFIIVFLISSFINTIYNELKAKKLKPTRRNLINETKTQSIGFLIGGLILAFAIYLINLWKGFIFIFLISGLIYSIFFLPKQLK